MIKVPVSSFQPSVPGQMNQTRKVESPILNDSESELDKSVAAKKRWYQIGLSTILVLMLLIAIPSAWISHQMNRSAQFRKFLLECEKIGKVEYSSQAYLPEYVRLFYQDSVLLPEKIQIENQNVPDGLEEWLGECQSLIGLTLIGCDLKDEELEAIRQLQKLEKLSLSGNQLTDKTLGYLEPLEKLIEVDFAGNAFSDEALAKVILKNKDLKMLQVGSTGFGDKSLFALRPEKVIALFLNNTKITDVSLLRLAEFKKLRSLRVSNTELTFRNAAGLGEIPRLFSLDASNTKIANQGVKNICQIQSLGTLELANTKITDECIPCFVQLAQLNTLELHSNDLTSDCKNDLSKLTQLNRLTIPHYDFLGSDAMELQNRMTGVSVSTRGVNPWGDSELPKSIGEVDSGTILFDGFDLPHVKIRSNQGAELILVHRKSPVRKCLSNVHVVDSLSITELPMSRRLP